MPKVSFGQIGKVDSEQGAVEGTSAPPEARPRGRRSECFCGTGAEFSRAVGLRIGECSRLRLTACNGDAASRLAGSSGGWPAQPPAAATWPRSPPPCAYPSAYPTSLPSPRGTVNQSRRVQETEPNGKCSDRRRLQRVLGAHFGRLTRLRCRPILPISVDRHGIAP